MIKKILWIFSCMFMGIITVQAKSYNFYFYPNGGKVKTSGFVLGDYGYLNYNGTFYASYNEKSTIKKINSIKGVPFQLKKSGTTLVKGKEWYTIVDGKTYFFNESKSYSMKTILKTLTLENEDFYSFDLYANWEDNKKANGIDWSDITDKSNDKEKVPQSNQNKNYVKIEYHLNGGTLAPNHSEKIYSSNGYIYKNQSKVLKKITYGEKTDNTGLANYNSPSYINAIREGYYVLFGKEWNDQKNGKGKSYSQSKVYSSSDFCNASKKDCTKTLYLNWKKISFKKVEELKVPSSVAKTGYTSAQSIVYTGKYFIIVLTNPERKTGLYIFKKNGKSWRHYKTIMDLPYGHGQDVTYVPKTNEIVFNYGKMVAFIDADTFKEKSKIELSSNYSCIAYDQKKDLFILGVGNREEKKFYYTICNSRIDKKSCKKKAFSSNRELSGQGCEVNNGYFYKLNYDSGHANLYQDSTLMGQKGGEIDIYDSKYNHHNKIQFTASSNFNDTTGDLGELEGIDFIGKTPYLLFNGTRDGAFGRVYIINY